MFEATLSEIWILIKPVQSLLYEFKMKMQTSFFSPCTATANMFLLNRLVVFIILMSFH